MTELDHASALLLALQTYRETWCSTPHLYSTFDPNQEAVTCDRFVKFVEGNFHCFERSNAVGHMTGSALVVSPDLTQVLLTHHRKLGTWLQLGGHADGNPNLDDVAMTEAMEESGLGKLHFLSYESTAFARNISLKHLPFDIDSHIIPARRSDVEHLHFDVRYLVVSSDEKPPVVSHESHDVRWFTIPEARRMTAERSMHRQFDKVDALRSMLF